MKLVFDLQEDGMKEYIERGMAVKAAQDGADEWDGGFNRNRDAYIETAIDRVPTADVQEVNHGYYWGEEQVNTYLTRWCSNCKNRTPLANFCINCGSKMDSE